jgi:hypothetical protein
MLAEIKAAVVHVGSAAVCALAAVASWPMPGPVDDSTLSPRLIFAGILGAAVGACCGAFLTHQPTKSP